MELALYCPVYGYYEKERDTIGRHGDFFTSVSAGPLFGQLLACQFAGWFQAGECQGSSTECHGERQQPGPSRQQVLQIIEAGAHWGELARDILLWMRRERPGLFEHLEYWIIEPSLGRRRRQQDTLSEFSPKVIWAEHLLGAPCFSLSPSEGERGSFMCSPSHRQIKNVVHVRGSAITAAPGLAAPSCAQRIIFANELLDALPVHRLGWDAGARIWFEWGVALEKERFVWSRLNGPSLSQKGPMPEAPGCPRELLDVLPDGFVLEICPAATQWWREASRVVASGKLLVFDYGLTEEGFWLPERGRGTLRAYRCHRAFEDVLAEPGEQDITAHVNFTGLHAAGHLAGLQTEFFGTQTQFLTRIAERIWIGEMQFGNWKGALNRQFQTLTHPEHLGRAFRVLVQSRGESFRK